VSRRLLLASYFVFFAGLLLSGSIFYRGKPFDPKLAIISDLESPYENPQGYGWSAAATAICGALLTPAAMRFYRLLRKDHAKLAMAGAAMFSIGLGAAIAIGILAPTTRGYTPIHIQLAFAAFGGICCGTILYLIAVRAARGLIAFQFVILLFLVFDYIGPDLFDNKTLLTSLACCEWMLCLNCAVALWILASRVELQ
jgi:H+/Cl- antiporter ClcA